MKWLAKAIIYVIGILWCSGYLFLTHKGVDLSPETEIMTTMWAIALLHLTATE